MATNFPHRGELAPPPKPALSGYVGSDRHYRTGTGNPPLRPDPGAGPWNSRPGTAAAIAQHAGLLGLVMHGTPNVYPGINATRHLRHYLLNTGLPYTIDLEDMVRSVPSAGPWMVREFRQAQGFLKTLPVGRHRFTSIFAEGGSYNVQEENADWFFAIGGYARWGRGEATISDGKIGRHYEIDFEYCVYDRYNWDGGKSVTIMGTTVTDDFMGEFHRQGLAREFDCHGAIRRKLVWDGDFGAPDKTLILRRPGR